MAVKNRRNAMNQPLPTRPSLLDLLFRLRHEAPRNHEPPNPFPRGIVTQSATYRVYYMLLIAHPHELSCESLRLGCRAGRGAVAWALRYLTHKGAVQKLPHPRHAKNLVYRAIL
jgi:hypothetical protein